jgi:H+/Cl- antiporter ClcA
MDRVSHRVAALSATALDDTCVERHASSHRYDRRNTGRIARTSIGRPRPLASRPMRPSIPINRRSRKMFFSRAIWNRRVLFLFGAVVVGIVSVGFALAANAANAFFHSLSATAGWVPFVLVPAGFATIRWITVRWVPGSQGSGIPQAIAALALGEAARRRLLSLKVAFGKIVLTVVGLASGASIGREGPSVQVGAAIMYALSRTSAFPYEGMQRGLILAGGAAGVAAAFNAPLAGIVFAIEEMARSFEQRTISIVVTAVIVAGVVSLALQGNYAYFGHTAASVDLPAALPAVLMCGLVGGLCGGLFSRALLALGDGGFVALTRWQRERPVRFAALCGLALAAVGALSDGMIFGTGYEETRAMLNGTSHSERFGIAKLAATLISYLSGIPGGIFAPSLAVGAGFGHNLALLFPAQPAAALLLLGMGAYFAGVVQAPLTAFVIVLEMTQNAELALPLMAATLIANGVSRTVCPRPLYKQLARGFKLVH